MEDHEEIFPFMCGLCHAKYNKINQFYNHFLSHDLDTSCCFHLCDEGNTRSSLAEIHLEHRIADKCENGEISRSSAELEGINTDKCEDEPERNVNKGLDDKLHSQERSNEEQDKSTEGERQNIEKKIKNADENIDNHDNSEDILKNVKDDSAHQNPVENVHNSACDTKDKDRDADCIADISDKSNKNETNKKDTLNNLYTCSICSYAFPTICTLHSHLTGCANRGSYSYDDDKKVAYPFDSECSYINHRAGDNHTSPMGTKHSTNVSQTGHRNVKKKKLTEPTIKISSSRKRRKRRPKILEDFVTTVKQEPGETMGKMYIHTKVHNYEDNNYKNKGDTSDDDYEPSPQKRAGKPYDAGLPRITSLPNSSGEKRKRGRPRKSNIERAGDEVKNSKNKLNSGNVKLPEDMLKNGGKRKRGRPRKSSMANNQKDGDNIRKDSAELGTDTDQSTKSKLLIDGDIDAENLPDEDQHEYVIEKGVKIGVKLKKRSKLKKRKLRAVKVKVEKMEATGSKRPRRSVDFWGDGKKGSDMIACAVCQKKFLRYRMDSHMISHSDARRFKCEICDKSFKYRGHLREHKLIHNDGTPYVCDICGQGHYKMIYLKYHMMKHRGERPMKCHVCGLSFRSTNNLNRHLLTHSEKKDYTCDQCGRSFKRKDFLTQHMRIHKKEKSHLCTECDKSFYTNYQLTCHIMTHSGERPNTCPECGVGYIQRKELRKHMKQRHNRILEPTIKTNVRDYNAMVEGAHSDKKTLVKEDQDYMYTTPVKHFKKAQKHSHNVTPSEPQYAMFEYVDEKVNISHNEERDISTVVAGNAEHINSFNGDLANNAKAYPVLEGELEHAKAYSVEGRTDNVKAYSIEGREEHAKAYSVEGTGDNMKAYSIEGREEHAKAYSIEGREEHAKAYSIEGTGDNMKAYSIEGREEHAKAYSIEGTGDNMKAYSIIGGREDNVKAYPVLESRLTNVKAYSVVEEKDEKSLNVYREDTVYGVILPNEEQNNPDTRASTVRGISAQLQHRGIGSQLQSQVTGIGTQLETRDRGISAQLQSQLTGISTQLETHDSGITAQLQSQVTGISTQLESQVRDIHSQLNSPLNLATEQAGDVAVEVGYQGVGNEIQVYYGDYSDD